MLLSDTLTLLGATTKFLASSGGDTTSQAVLAAAAPSTFTFPPALDSLSYTPSTYLRKRQFSSVCVVRSTQGDDDTSNFEAAVAKCGQGGLIHLPDAV